MKRLIPTYFCKSIFDIPLSFFKDNNIKYIFTDLDNTLDGYDILYPTPRVFKLVADFKNAGLEIVILSNNHEERVKNYSAPLGVKYMYHTGKPFPKKILKYIEDNNIDKNEVILIGDQIITDVQAGNNAKIKVMLTDKIVPQDQPVTRFNRIADNFFRKRMRKKGILQNREVK